MPAINTETVAYSVADIGRSHVIVGFRVRMSDETERWEYTVNDLGEFRDRLHRGRIGTVTGRKPDGRLVLYAVAR